MGGSFPFHYKNNFRATRYKDSDEMNVALDYATRTGCHFTDVWPDFKANQLVDLDETGAEMLLKGERLIDKSKSQTLYSTEITDREGYTEVFDMDFCDLGHKFVIQMISKKSPELGQTVAMKGKITDGKLIPDEKLSDFWEYGKLPSVQREFKNALETAQKIYNG